MLKLKHKSMKKKEYVIGKLKQYEIDLKHKYANIINKRIYPRFSVNQVRGSFADNEQNYYVLLFFCL